MVDKRWRQHKSALRCDTHHCVSLQAAYNASVEADFVFEILQYCTHQTLRSGEQALLDNMTQTDFNISVHAVAGDMLTRHPDRSVIIAKRAAAQRQKFKTMTQSERQAKWGKPGTANGMWGRTHTAAVRAAAGARLRGKPSTFKGKKHTDVAKAQLSAHASKRVGDHNPFYGKHHTDATKAKIAKARKGSIPANARRVSADGTVYASLNEAARHFNVTGGAIYHRIRSDTYDYHYC